MKNKRLYEEKEKMDFELVVRLLKAYKAIHERVSPIFRAGGLTVSQFSTLEVLYHNGELKTSEVMEKILSTPGNMTVVINNLIKSKLIQRSDQPEDKRCKMLKITEKGKQIIEKVFAEHFIEIKSIFSILPEKEKSTLTQLLKKISGNK